VRTWSAAVVVLVIALAMPFAGPTTLGAQQRGGAAPRSARDAAPIDLTGYWVSYVTENWRYRMVTPAKGEYRRIPVAPAALPLINNWDPAADDRAGNQCKSYGAGAIMSVPGRLHITWQDADTLRIDIDAGTQTRLFHFSARAAASAPTWQGESSATWERANGPDGGGSLRVVTSNLRAGYLRKNGVPYSAGAVLTEYYDLTKNGNDTLLTVTTIVDDPTYLRTRRLIAYPFKKEANGDKWDPTPCSARW